MHTLAPTAALRAGARASVPWLAAIAPFGFVIGVTAAERDISAPAAWLTGPLLFAGSSQLAVLQLLDERATIAVIVVTTVAINVRLLFYGAAMAPHWSDRSTAWRMLAAAVLVEPTFAIGLDAYDDDRVTDPHRHYLGAAAAVAASWLGAMTLGMVAGGSLPAWLGLGAIVPLFLVGELAARPRTGTAAAAIIAATPVAIAGNHLPHHLGTVAAVVAGVSSALLVEERS